MKYIALLLGLLIATPAMAQNPNSSGRKDSPSTQGPSTKRQDPNRQGQNGRGTNPRPSGGGISPGLLRRFDTNGDGRLSNEEKAAARRRIAQWRNRDRGNDNPRGGDRGSRGGRGNGPKPDGRGSRGSRGNGPRPQPGAGRSGNGPRPRPGARRAWAGPARPWPGTFGMHSECTYHPEMPAGLGGPGSARARTRRTT